MTKRYTVSFDADAKIVRVRMTGAATHDDHCSARDEVMKLCESNTCSKLLVDLRELSTERSTTISCFTFGEALALTPQYLRIAHVLPVNPKAAEDVRFTSTVVANRGKTTGEFCSLQEAEQWLFGSMN